MDILAWIGLALLYLVLLFVVGLTALRKGHTILFFLGLFVPLIWIIGAVMPTTNAAMTARSRSNLR